MILKILVVFLCATSTMSLYLKQAPTLCNTTGCLNAADYIGGGLDESINPCDDFYAFTCNNYIKQGVLFYNEFNTIYNDQYNKLIGILNELTDENGGFKSKSAELIYRLYDSCGKSWYNTWLGFDKAKEILEEFGGWVAANEGDLPKVDWTEIAFKLSANGLNANIFLPLLITPNIYDKEKHALAITGPPSVLAYPHILKQDFSEPDLKNYINSIVYWATTMGATNVSYAEEEAKKIVELERKLSQIQQEINFDQMSVSELQTKYPAIIWKTYLSKVTNIDIKDDDAVLYPVECLSKISHILSTTPQRTLASYVQYRAIAELVSAVGAPTMTSTERNCFQLITNRLPIAVSALYVRKYISKETKQQATELVGKVKSSFLSLIESNERIDDATKNAAIKKIENIYDLVAYPDELLDDEVVNKYYEPVEYKENFLEFLASVSKNNNNATFSNFRTVPNRDAWGSYASIIAVSAKYNPFSNAILIFAGIIASPFYNPNFPNYMNYASMGSTIGHEINHGMSGIGLEYDENGLKKFWASDEALAKFNETSNCLHSQYVQEHNDEAMARRTNNEDQADAMGVIVAYSAYQSWIQVHSDEEGRLPSLEKYTPNQLFWISYGRFWCAAESEQYLNNFLKTNIHSRQMYRVRVPVMNSEEFSKDFKCQPGSKMNPVKKCKIWN